MHQTKLNYNPLHELETISNLDKKPFVNSQNKTIFLDIKKELKVLMRELNNRKPTMKIV